MGRIASKLLFSIITRSIWGLNPNNQSIWLGHVRSWWILTIQKPSYERFDHFGFIFWSHIFESYFGDIFSICILESYFGVIFSSHIFETYFRVILLSPISGSYFFETYIRVIFSRHVLESYFRVIFWSHFFESYLGVREKMQCLHFPAGAFFSSKGLKWFRRVCMFPHGPFF